MGEQQQPLMTEGEHFQIDNLISSHNLEEGSSSMEESFNTPLSAGYQEADAAEDGALLGDVNYKQPEGATVLQTSVNIAKMCMGTGTLALPFAAEKGGLVFNMVGLFFIGFWNYYSANCLLRCLQYLPAQFDKEGGGKAAVNGSCNMAELEQQPVYGTMDSNGCENNRTHNGRTATHDNNGTNGHSMPPPPDGTTTYGAVAWYASGPKVAMMSFITDTPLTTGSRNLDLLIPSVIVAILSCGDIEFLSTFSGIGLLAVGLSFMVISFQGFQENGFSGFRSILELNLWPESLSAASSWFGVVVFGYGVVPFVFNFKESMASPKHLDTSLQIGLFMVYVGYIVISNGVMALFSPTHVFDGDVLQAMPDTWISMIVRLLMTFVVALTAPLIVIPCGELVEGKLGIDNTQQSYMYKKIVVRVLFCIVCVAFSEFVPNGFVHVVSFIGCFCVAMAGFVLPPLFCIQLSNKGRSLFNRGLKIDSVLLCDVCALVIGIIATTITSTMTFRELMTRAELTAMPK
ncbi:hypothetical protein ACHAXR_006822 [Thalassiosira sp. AJA248-18]